MSFSDRFASEDPHARRQAEDDYILARLPIAARIAGRAARGDRDIFDDLYQEAALGLVEVVRHRPTDHPARLEALAVLWMRRRVSRALGRRAFSLGDPPDHALRDWLRLAAAGHRLRAVLDHEPTLAEIARAAGFTLHRAADLRHAEAAVLSLDAPRAHAAFSEPLAPEPEAMPAALPLLRAALARLPELERQIVRAQYGYDAPYESVRALARRLRMSPRRILALRRVALALLRDLLDGHAAAA